MWAHKFQFIGPTVIAVVGSTHLGRPAGPNQTPESRQVLLMWWVVVLAEERSKT